METPLNLIAKALCEAQKKIGAAAKDSLNPHFKSKYASLEAVWEACHQILNDHDLAVTQTYLIDEHSNPLLKTTLIHISGQKIESFCPLIMVKQDMQGFGSASSYARRYSLAAMVGVVQEDDDGNNAAKQSPIKQNQIDQDPGFEPPVNDMDQHPADSNRNYEPAFGNYIPTFGKYKTSGTPISEIDTDELMGYIEFLKESAERDHKPLTKGAAELIDVCEKYWHSK